MHTTEGTTKVYYAPASYAETFGNMGITHYGYAVHIVGLGYHAVDVFIGSTQGEGHVCPDTKRFDREVKKKLAEAFGRGGSSSFSEIRDYETDQYGNRMWPGHDPRPRRTDTPFGASAARTFEWAEKIYDVDLYEEISDLCEPKHSSSKLK
jgi:hypothetical protein